MIFYLSSPITKKEQTTLEELCLRFLKKKFSWESESPHISFKLDSESPTVTSVEGAKRQIIKRIGYHLGGSVTAQGRVLKLEDAPRCRARIHATVRAIDRCGIFL